MTLHMIQITPDMIGAAGWAHQNNVASADGGYLMHALLKANFGSLAPKPFAMTAKSGKPAKVLAYSPHSAEQLREQAQMFAEPAALEAVSVTTMISKTMPQVFARGARLGFEVRVRPVVRAARGAGERAGKERDAFLAAIHGLPKDTRVDRIEVYRQWLARALSPAAGIQQADPIYQRLTPVTRRNAASETGARPLTSLRGPDVAFSGVLHVAESEAFSALLTRGVGRHRAFGFGMLLLRPPE